MTSELESNSRDTQFWGRIWLIDFNARKTLLVSFHRSNNFGVIYVKRGRSALDEKSNFGMLGLSFSSKLDRVLKLFI